MVSSSGCLFVGAPALEEENQASSSDDVPLPARRRVSSNLESILGQMAALKGEKEQQEHETERQRLSFLDEKKKYAKGKKTLLVILPAF